MRYNIDQKILTVLSLLLFILYGFLTFLNLIWTTYVSSTQNDYHEKPYWTLDISIVTLILVAAVFGILFLIDRYYGISKISTKKLRFIASIFLCTVGILWIFMSRTYPVHDQSIVSNAAGEFINGNYDQLNPGEYLSRFTHQLGIVFIFQLIYSVVGTGNTTFIMLLNVILLCGTYNILFLILKKFTPSARIHNLYWLITFFSFAPIFYCTFVYGTIIGLFFAVTALYFLIKFTENKRIPDFVISFLFFAISCIAKSNYEIYVIAAFLVLIFKAIQQKKLFFVPFAILITLSMFCSSFINMYYSSASGTQIGKGSPASLWVAMGLQEGPCGNGWYNQYNVITYGSVNGDYDQANAVAKEDISKSLSNFGKKPLYASKFFFDKTISQWNDPSFQSLWMSDYWNNHSDELSSTANSIYNGVLNKIFIKIMDLVALFIWLGSAVFYFIKRKELSIEQFILGIIFMGGFIFHFFWEAKALYTMPYFFISIIAGVQGMDFMLNKFNRFMNKYTVKNKK